MSPLGIISESTNYLDLPAKARVALVILEQPQDSRKEEGCGGSREVL